MSERTRAVNRDSVAEQAVLAAQVAVAIKSGSGTRPARDEMIEMDDFHNSRSAGVATVATLVEIVLSGSVTERATGHLSAAAGCAERTIRRSPAVTTTQSTRLPQPWRTSSPTPYESSSAASSRRSACASSGQCSRPPRAARRLSAWQTSSPMPYRSNSAASDVSLERSACASSGQCSRPPRAAGQLSAWRTSSPMPYESSSA